MINGTTLVVNETTINFSSVRELLINNKSLVVPGKGDVYIQLQDILGKYCLNIDLRLKILAFVTVFLYLVWASIKTYAFIRRKTSKTWKKSVKYQYVQSQVADYCRLTGSLLAIYYVVIVVLGMS